MSQGNDSAFLVILFMVQTLVLIFLGLMAFAGIRNFKMASKPRLLVVILLLVGIGYWWYKVWEIVDEDAKSETGYDPYEILGIPFGEND